MCENCYIEEGSPKIVTPYIMDAVNKIKILYATESGELGGYGHIVFDDWNLEDHSIRSSIDSAFNCEYKKLEASKWEAVNALVAIYRLSEQERYSAMAIVDGFFDPLEGIEIQEHNNNKSTKIGPLEYVSNWECDCPRRGYFVSNPISKPSGECLLHKKLVGPGFTCARFYDEWDFNNMNKKK